MSSVNDGILKTTYVETSSLLAAILDEDADAHRELVIPARRVTSALTLVEARRAVTRERIQKRIDADQETALLVALETFTAQCTVSAITTDILQRAGRRFPVEPVRTLDAIHLATIESVGIPPHLVRVVTRDRRVRENARAMGYDCPA